ncbi:hypothetical protein GJ744_003645 [Endocarpon pusillum]|uniref:Uncharacterized protein n=1 Tax=Endocarpon pusillum TaxID=364733 RepID=A0A8H7E0H5_9EURO|nr:hypothetical protein GJ744_003645 [Endocarpon pusillum]
MDEVNERTRLLENENCSPNGHVPELRDTFHQHVQDPVDEFLENGLSTPKLLAMMLSVWIGTFLSALGMSITSSRF